MSEIYDFSDDEAPAVVFSPALPEPALCILDGEGDCINYEIQPDLGCTCKYWCGEGSEAGCCVCRHHDIYNPCPRFGYGCDGPGECPCGDKEDPCCTIEQRAFAAAARAYLTEHPMRPNADDSDVK